MVLRPVFPVPRPRATRPGKRRFRVAIECAVTGAMREGATATPVPNVISRVR